MSDFTLSRCVFHTQHRSVSQWPLVSECRDRTAPDAIQSGFAFEIQLVT